MKKILVAGLIVLVVGVVTVGAIIRSSALAPETRTPGVNGTGNGSGGGWGQNQTPITIWQTVNGTVVRVDAVTLVVKLDNGESIIVENRPWAYALEQRFKARVGDRMTVIGFDYGGIFVVGKLQNVTIGKTIVLRDEFGRPVGRDKGEPVDRDRISSVPQLHP